MKILMLTWEYPPRIIGGIARVVYNLSKNYSDMGNEVHIVTLWEEGIKKIEEYGNIKIHRIGTYEIKAHNFVNWVMQMNFSMLEKSLEIADKGIDVIHSHDWLVAYASRVIKRRYGIPLVATIHATEHGRNWGIHNDTQKYINDVEWWFAYEAWRVIVNSSYMKNEVLRLFSVPEDKLKVIPNGISLNKFDNCSRDMECRRKYAMDNEKIVFFVGRLVNEKGAQVLLDAVPKILQYYSDAKFVIAGKGPQLDFLKHKAQYMGIQNKVLFTGFICDDELDCLYRCIDVAVVPSLYEPFGIVALEAMAAGVPVVVSGCGGLSDIVEHGIDGMKAYCGNSNSVADCVLEILHCPDKAAAMVNKAFEKVREKYDWKLISEKTLKVYEEITIF